MNYLLCHGWIFLFGGLCLLASLIYSMFNGFDELSDDMFLFAEDFGRRVPGSLQAFNLEKWERWNDYPTDGDLFTSRVLPVQLSSVSDEEHNSISDNHIGQRVLCSIQLDGWANVKGKMVFVFSSTVSRASCLGSIGDSFEDPAFTVLSFDLENFDNHSNGYSIPLVTILDKEFNQRVVLTPVSCTELLNEIN